jgi:hypothetical protein
MIAVSVSLIVVVIVVSMIVFLVVSMVVVVVSMIVFLVPSIVVVVVLVSMIVVVVLVSMIVVEEILLTQFYGARKEKDEDISHWSCRLERIIGKCVDGGLVHHSEVDQQLHFMLWNGLKASLKAISGYKYDTIKDFDGLRVALRQIENYVPQDSTSTYKPHISKAVTGRLSLVWLHKIA